MPVRDIYFPDAIELRKLRNGKVHVRWWRGLLPVGREVDLAHVGTFVTDILTRGIGETDPLRGGHDYTSL